MGLGHGGFRFLQIVGQPFQALNLGVQFMLLGHEVFRGGDVVFFRGAPKRVVALLEHAKLRGVRLLLPSQVVERVGQVLQFDARTLCPFQGPVDFGVHAGHTTQGLQCAVQLAEGAGVVALQGVGGAFQPRGQF